MFRFPLARTLALTALACATTLSAAQAADKKALVQKVLQLQQPAIEAIGAGMVVQTTQQLLNGAGRYIGQVPADKRELIGNEIKAEAKKFVEDNVPAMKSAAVKAAPATYGAALEEKFSEDELKTLVAWLESPVSRKFQQMGIESQQALVQKIAADNRSTLEGKFKALDQSIAKKLGLPANAAPAKK
ncbi:MAG: hypothetical protein RLY78_2517 [Pseudomonadota bacterium]|jgi:hypothetical protein|uniref:DUF2059 domain-containing protein n=1 Tax=Pseudaquabacterium rugosum TaxID=2984194 RepID=A0ABU9BAM0_9BURK